MGATREGHCRILFALPIRFHAMKSVAFDQPSQLSLLASARRFGPQPLIVLLRRPCHGDCADELSTILRTSATQTRPSQVQLARLRGRPLSFAGRPPRAMPTRAFQSRTWHRFGGLQERTYSLSTSTQGAAGALRRGTHACPGRRWISARPMASERGATSPISSTPGYHG